MQYISQPKQFHGLCLQPVRVGVNWALYWYNKPVLFASKHVWVRQNVSQRLTLKWLKLKKMAKNIISDTDKSSSINKRVREDGTLIKEVDSIELVINRSGDKTYTNSKKSTKSFFRADPNYGPKSYDKNNKVLPLSQNQNDSNSPPEQCAKRKRSFKTSRGLNQHTRVCKEKQLIDTKVIETTSTTVFPITNVTVDEENIWNADSDVMKNKFDDMYNTVVHWRKSLFLLPSGSTGKRFIEEMTRLINSWTFRSEQDTAMKALMVLPTLLLQKTSFTSKFKDNVETLKRRLNQRKDGQIEKLLVEGKTIQEMQFKDSAKNQSSDRKATLFARFMEDGKVSKTLKLLESSNKGGILPLTEETFEVLLEKHPKASEASNDILIQEEVQNVHPVIYDSIDSEMVRDAIEKTRDSAGPSGLDADGWRRILMSGNFGSSGEDFRKKIADMTKPLCRDNTVKHLEAFLVCRLIPLDKQPGV